MHINSHNRLLTLLHSWNIDSEFEDVNIDLQLAKKSSSKFKAFANFSKAEIFHPSYGNFKIENGNSITAVPLPKVSDEDLLNACLHLPFACIFYQKDFIVLHGSCVESNGYARIYCGKSGSGKSTQALIEMMEGSRLISEDICVIDFVDGEPYVLSATPLIKINPIIYKKIKPKFEEIKFLKPDLKGRKTYKVPDMMFALNRYPLKDIFFLDDISLSKINPLDKLRYIYANLIPVPTWRSKRRDSNALKKTSQLIKKTNVSLFEKKLIVS